ncbi:MAG: hypothetical protein PHI06_04880 [Desulfobulbaceae bacterium]|nr:hypothetical protein [Desulfobulbaceae bacterium]
MESLLDFLEPLTWLLCTVALIILFFLFVARPLLHYLFAHFEIRQRKRRMEAIIEAHPSSLTGENQAASEEEKRVEDDPVPRQKTGVNDELARLAASDPAKAGELVKKWASSD